MTTQDALNWIQGGWRNDPKVRTINGKQGIDTDGFYGFQCKDFVNAYGSWLGHPFTAGNARVLWEQAQDPWYSRVSSPQPGDVSVFRPAPSNGQAGHTDIVLSGSFTAVAQNWGAGSNGVTGLPPATVNHTMTGLYGFLRPQFNKKEENMQPSAKQVGDVFRFMTGNDISQKDLDFYVSAPRTIYDLIYALGPDVQSKVAPIRDESTVRSLAKTFGQALTDDQVRYYAARSYATFYNDVIGGINQARIDALAAANVKPYDGPQLFVKK